MTRYIIVRVVWIFIVLFTILSLNFTLLKVAPEYPPVTEDERNLWLAKQVSDGYMTLEIEYDSDLLEEYRDPLFEKCDKCFYFDEGDSFRIFEPVPIAKQYFRWVSNIVTDWDWGNSTRVQVGVPAFDILKTRMPVTMKLNFLALGFYIPIGLGLGILAALKKNSRTDNVISLSVMIFISIPSFVVMTMLVMILGYEAGWLPTQFPAQDIQGAIQYKGLVIPILGLSFGSIAGLTRMTRAELTEVLTSEFLLLARTKGLTRGQSVIRHAMRNSMVPLIPGIIGSFIGVLSGSVIIEIIYGVPGTGRVFLRALSKNNYDYNLLLVTTAFYTTISLITVLLVDLSYGLVDPRIRMGARK